MILLQTKPPGGRPTLFRIALPVFALLAAGLLLVGGQGDARAQGAADVPNKYAGTYRIETWQSLQSSGMHHFFYLHPGGGFLLGAEWPGNESSTISGTWSVSGNLLYLNGKADVRTNQGNWVTVFQRTFKVHVGENGFRLVPLPEKNRFGMMGWPNAFEYFRRDPAPNLPGRKLPATEAGMAELLATLPKG